MALNDEDQNNKARSTPNDLPKCLTVYRQWVILFSGPEDVLRGIWLNKTSTVCSVIVKALESNIWSSQNGESAQRKEAFGAKLIWFQSRQQAKTLSPDV